MSAGDTRDEVARLRALVDLQAKLLQTSTGEAAHLLDGLCLVIDKLELGGYGIDGACDLLLTELKRLADGC